MLKLSVKMGILFLFLALGNFPVVALPGDLIAESKSFTDNHPFLKSFGTPNDFVFGTVSHTPSLSHFLQGGPFFEAIYRGEEFDYFTTKYSISVAKRGGFKDDKENLESGRISLPYYKRALEKYKKEMQKSLLQSP